MNTGVLVPIVPLLLVTSCTCALNEDVCADAYTTLEMSKCLERELLISEAQLKDYLDESLRNASSSEAARAALLESQAAWETYRDAECKAVYESYYPGSMSGIAYLGCKDKLTRQRTYDLWDTYLRNSTSGLSEPERCGCRGE